MATTLAPETQQPTSLAPARAISNGPMSNPLIWIELSQSGFAHNLAQIRALVGPRVKVAACIKGNAYGHGLLPTATLLDDMGVDWFCAFSLDEAVSLRESGVTHPILALGYIPDSHLSEVIRHDLRLMLYSVETARALNEVAGRFGAKAKVHIKTDTGMTRLGFRRIDSETLFALKALPNLELEGLASHFATSDEGEPNEFAHRQIEQFEKWQAAVLACGINPQIRHMCNSAAIVRYPEVHYDLVRPGRMLYGYLPDPDFLSRYQPKLAPLRQVLTLKARVIDVKSIEAGAPIGYGCTYVSQRPMRVAALPLGYADGLSRFLSNRGAVLIHGQRAPIVGRVSMNLSMVDVTDIPQTKVGDEVVVLGQQGDQMISTFEHAELCDTLPYNVLCALQAYIPRILVA